MLLARSLRRAEARLLARPTTLLPPCFALHATRPVSAVPLTPHSRSYASSSGASGDNSEGFAALGFHAPLVAALAEMGLTTPTSVQRKSAAAILARKDVLCTAQTGTGKTLAYLAPLAEMLHRHEAAARATAAAVSTGAPPVQTNAVIARPQVLVIVPSRELALQVGDVAKRLAHVTKFASCTVTSGEPKRRQQASLQRPLDMVIGTPGRLAKCIAKADFFVSRVTTVVIDEADTLLDAKRGFRAELDAVLKPIQASAAKRKAPLQMVLVAATLQPPLDTVVKKKFGDLGLISDDKLHQTPTLLKEEFRKVSPETKHSALREALHQRRVRDAKTIVFCRTAASCNAADHMLREHGFASRCLHGDMPTPLREASVRAFGDSVQILVCTDLAARGLHFDAVQHVIMCDFPASAVDYVHRAGRAGRAGEVGYVTSLVTKYDAALAHTIEEAKQNRKAIKSLKGDLAKVVGEVEEDEEDAEEGTDEEAEEKVSRTKKTSRDRAMTGHGTKRLRKHKLRTL
jgi:superfamily II DNA/RNA helicase